MHVKKIVLRNWLGYAGEHTLELEPTLYAITAQHEGDARRSNWAGKTSLIEALRFAFYGRSRATTADGWITEGEGGGQVDVVLSNGAQVMRSRKVGHATKLSLVDEDGSVLAGDAAQKRLEAMLGYSADDFEVTCWFGQKQMARLITARPGDRFELVSGWFDLGKLREAEARAVAYLGERVAQRERLQREVADARAVVESVRERWPASVMASNEEMVAQLERAAGLAEAAATERERLIDKAENALRTFDEAKSISDDRATLAQVQQQGKALAAELRALAGAQDRQATARAAVEQAATASRLLGADYEKKRVLASGRFDGCCPVDERACPVKGEINERATENARLAREAHDLFAGASREEAGARARLAEADRDASRQAKIAAQVDAMREQARVLLERTKGSVGWAFDEAAHAAARRILEECRTAYRTQVGLAAALRRDAATVSEQQAKIDKAQNVLAASKEAEDVHRAAVHILGRQGAQRVIAEEALAEIEAGANAMLREAGIDLSVRVSWSREGSGLAKVCAECGTAFPPKAKACKRCGAERGHLQVERLDVGISDTSGAAEDLAGAALQLAAAAWLRRERGAALCTAFLDEPFGALDEANRRAFAAHLVALLRGASGFEQAFIVAHHPDVLDGLPGRILVTRTATGSTAEVV